LCVVRIVKSYKGTVIVTILIVCDVIHSCDIVVINVRIVIIIRIVVAFGIVIVITALVICPASFCIIDKRHSCPIGEFDGSEG
jgi:hypothetical protein